MFVTIYSIQTLHKLTFSGTVPTFPYFNSLINKDKLLKRKEK